MSKKTTKKKYFKGPKLGPKVSFFRSLPNFTDGLIIIFFLAWFNYIFLAFYLKTRGEASPLAACSPATTALAPSALDNKYTYI